MRTLVLTGCSPAMAEVHALTVESKRAWSARHGYDFHEIRRWDAAPAIVWQKMEWIQRMLAHYDEVVWLDADAIVTNAVHSTTNLVETGRNDGAVIYASKDWGPCDAGAEWFWFNTGNMIVRVAPDWELLFEAMFRLGRERWWNTWGFEQSTLQALKRVAPWSRMIEVLPRAVLNAVPRSVQQGPDNAWHPVCFLAHITGVPNERRVEILKEGFE